MSADWFDVMPRELLDLAIKATVLLVVAGAITLAMHRRSAALRHLVWTLTLVGVLAIPIVSGVVPRWELPAVFRVPAAAPTADLRPVALPLPDGDPSQGVSFSPSTTPGVPAVAPIVGVREETARRPSAAAAADARPLPWVLLIWGGGGIAVLVGVVASLLGLARLRRRAHEVTRGALLRRVQTLAAQLDIRRPVRVVVSEHECMPMTWGVFEPTILLPESANAWPPARLRAVLLHELAHVRRHDFLTQLLARTACALYWFNPLIWYGAKRMRVERERACDDVVLAAGSRPSDYASHLLELARTLRTGGVASMASVSMAKPSQLSGRLSAVLDGTRRRSVNGKWVTLIGWLVAALVVSPLAGATHGVPHVGEPSSLEAAAVAPFGVAPNHLAQESPAADIGNVPDARRVPVTHGAVSNEQGCDWSSDRSHSTSISAEDDEVRIRVRVGDCRLEIDARGDITFNEQETDVIGISAGGYLELEERDGRVTRRLEMTPLANGQLQRRYRVNGDVQWTVTGPIVDRETATWFARLIPVLFRRAGYQAEQRARRLLAQGGVDAVMREVTLIPGDHTARQYIAVVLSHETIRADQVREVVRTAGRQIQSDYELAELLIAVANNQPLDETVRVAYVEAAGSINSDYEQRRVLSAMLVRDDLSREVAGAVLELATQIGSDYELAELLINVTTNRPLDQALIPLFFAAVATIDSDHERGRVLRRTLDSGTPDREALDKTLEAALEISSDYELAELLIAAAREYPIETALPASFIRAARSLDSDHEAGRVWTLLLTRDALPPRALEGLLDAARDIGSDWELANVLVLLASKHDLTDGIRRAFFQAVAKVGSDHHRARTLRTVARRESVERATIAAVLESAAHIGSDYELASLLVDVSRAYPIDDSLRPAYLRAADSIGSRDERDRALAALTSG